VRRDFSVVIYATIDKASILFTFGFLVAGNLGVTLES